MQHSLCHERPKMVHLNVTLHFGEIEQGMIARPCSITGGMLLYRTVTGQYSTVIHSPLAMTVSAWRAVGASLPG